MGARGRRGLIVGLEDLARGVVLATQMRRAAAQDALERERFEFDKEQATAAYEDMIGKRKAAQSAKADEARQAQAAKLSEQIQRGRISKNLESGNLTRAARIAYNRFGERIPEATLKLYSPDDPVKSEYEGLTDEEIGRAIRIKAGLLPRAETYKPEPVKPSAIDRYKETEALAAEIGGVPAIPYNMGKASPFVQGVDKLPMPKTTAPDAYESMSREEWDDVVQSAVEDALGHPLTEEDAANPLVTTLRVTDPRHRKEILAGIPKMFIYTRPR